MVVATEVQKLRNAGNRKPRTSISRDSAVSPIAGVSSQIYLRSAERNLLRVPGTDSARTAAGLSPC